MSDLRTPLGDQTTDPDAAATAGPTATTWPIEPASDRTSSVPDQPVEHPRPWMASRAGLVFMLAAVVVLIALAVLAGRWTASTGSPSPARQAPPATGPAIVQPETGSVVPGGTFCLLARPC